jgi:RNA polymerase sigma factor (sigma-70 family)
MAASDLSVLVRQLHHLTKTGDAEGVPDAELLRRYLQGDEAGFELLVYRHGAMIFGVCRRLLGDHHDAEDAFQAVFLTLARKARSIRQGVCLPAWLHTTANRLALRILAERRQSVAAIDDRALLDQRLSPSATAEQKELASLLDAEVNRLPSRLRIAFILCQLQEKTCAEAAGELGCPVGTVASRLARARERLRQRLAQRGLALPAAGLLATLPTGLTAATTRAATRLATGQSLVGHVSSRVLGLSRQSSSRLAAVCLAMAALVGLTAALAATAPPSLPRQAIAVAPIPNKEVDAELLQGLWRPVCAEENGKALIDPELRQTRFHFAGDRVVWKTLRERREGQFNIQPGQPSLIQLTIKSNKSEETTLHGICQVKGDHVRICVGPEFDAPKQFSTRPPQGQDAARTYYELRRAPIDQTPAVRTFQQKVQQYTHGGKIDPKTLPPIDPIVPWGSLLLSQTKADDALLRQMEDLKQIYLLRLDHTKVTEKGLASLARVSELEILSLDQLPVSDAGLKHLAGLTELRELNVYGCRKVTDAGLKHLRNLKQLAALTLGGTGITSAGLTELSGLTEISQLVLTDTAVDDAGLAALKGMKQLRAIYAGGTRIKGTGMKALRDLSQFRFLTLDRTPVTEEGLKEIGKLRELWHLTLSGTPTTDAGVAGLSDLKLLRGLSLDGTRITGTGLKSLVGLSKLQTINLDSTPMTEEGLEHLAKMKALRLISLKNCSQLPPSAIEKLKAALPGCEVVLR